MFTNMNTGQAQTMTGHILWLSLKWESQVSDFFSQWWAGWLLWFVCLLVVRAAGGDYCYQTTRSINKAKVPYSLN